ncbi:Glycoside hydrolase, superfamily [Niveomyces insectorum RCEF 264]|uniref:Glycoside hydrolase, superfamily n=1 Tax=Niveomyces insectorum RCEF 264 TaxID=1081102 RepID=A0A167X939_9HYPO|nr:Glycoside hydrolase, superfamily [Niveomyces insectorum RCEF 264]
MSPLRLLIEDGVFKDTLGRQVVLRGINVAGDAKYPSNPETPSHVVDDFFDGDNISFHQRPFSKDDAHLHFSRLKKMGYNTIRYVFTWEAIEYAGPGRYDEEWIQHTIALLRTAKEYGFYVFMDPHQDVWSRFCGGSGAPMWTLYACGLNPRHFAATEAAIVHNTYPDSDEFPKMIWSTNYYRLAAATMFTLFFGGRDFAPKCIIDGKNIQDYLQEHYIGAVAHLARCIQEAGDLANDVIFGWESLNEPNKGIIGHPDISTIPKEQALKKGTCPTIWQTMLTGMGRPCEVETWDMGGLGPVRTGRTLIDPQGAVAWLPADYDDSRYGYKRDPGWRLGECVWAQHGVWDPATDTLLRKNYFAKNPRTGETIDYPCFSDTYFMDHFRRYRDTIRRYHPDAILLLQGPTMEMPPQIKGTADDEPRLVYAPHFYDGITLMTKKWNRTWNVDVLGVLRGRYLHPAFAIRIGETAIRNCFRDQLAAMRKEGLDRMGKHPCILTEFGIPYDMDDKQAYETGDYSSQSAAMDANHYGVEGAMLEGYTLWQYMTKNNHDRGDQWNGEDLSIVSLDDTPLPVSQLPRGPERTASTSNLRRMVTATSPGLQGKVEQPAASSADAPQQPPPSPYKEDTEQDGAVNPSNLRRALTQPSISSQPTNNSRPVSPAPAGTPGFRAAEAYVRPALLAAAGSLVQYGFDLRRCAFSLTVQGQTDDEKVAATPEEDVAALAPPTMADDDGDGDGNNDRDGLLPVPTVVWLPEYHFPADSIEVEVSAGHWEIAWDEEEAVLLQKLRWWHPPGTHALKVGGRVRAHNYVEGVSSDDGYYDQLSNWVGASCSVM